MSKKKKNWLEDWNDNDSNENKFSFKKSSKPKKEKVFIDGGIMSKKPPRFTTPSDREEQKVKSPQPKEAPNLLEDESPLVDGYDETLLRDDIAEFFKRVWGWIFGLVPSLTKKVSSGIKAVLSSTSSMHSKKYIFGALGVASIVLVTILALNLTGLDNNAGDDNTAADQSGGFTQNTTADFTALKPADNPDIEIGFDPQRGVASFATQIAGVDVVVSQQPIPEAFKLDPASNLSRVANDFGATQAIELGDFKAFSGINSETNQQTVIFTKNGVLVFMNSTGELNIGSLVDFIQSLE